MSFIDPITLWTGPRVSHRGGDAQHGSLSTGVGIYLPRQEFAPTASWRAIAHPAERSFGVDRCDEIPGRHGCAHIRTASNALQVVRSVSALLPPARLLLLTALVVVVRISVLAWPSAELSLSPAQRGLANHTGFHDCPRPVSSKRLGGPGRTRTCNQGIHLAPPFPTGVDYLFTRDFDDSTRFGCGTLLPVIKGPRGIAPQPSGSLCTFRRCIAGLAQGCHRSRDRKGSLNSSRPLRGFRREGTVRR